MFDYESCPDPKTAELHRELANLDRQVFGAVILPRDKPPTIAQMDQVRAAFREQLKKSEMLVERAAHRIEYSSAVLFEWLAGRYEGNLEKVTRRVNV